MVNFYRRFLNDAALVLKLLTDALKVIIVRGPLQWSTEVVVAFTKNTCAMLNAVELAPCALVQSCLWLWMPLVS